MINRFVVIYATLLGVVVLAMAQSGLDLYRDYQSQSANKLGREFSLHVVSVEQSGGMELALLAIHETTDTMYLISEEGDAAQVLDSSLAEEILEDDQGVLNRLVTGVAAIRLDATCNNQKGCVGEIVPIEVHASMEGEVSVNRRDLATGEVDNTVGFVHGAFKTKGSSWSEVKGPSYGQSAGTLTSVEVK